ncbi:uncharacterized protein LOC114317404 [Camellia sinensis]|uniref:uncharacterized protein LOC114317404 n=1 Tax=Camellia sinensis TaxID=4442 RepID=UPI001036D112|nr:uncharacterized protein LOC114317404 [Camellia sinensis]
MGKCISLTALQNQRYRHSFGKAGLKSVTTDLGDGTVMHFWIPKSHKPNKPTLLLIHGINAMWQWNPFISRFSSKFNVYVPGLLFFGDSYTTLPDRTEAFQARSIMRAMEAYGVARSMLVVGLSYGGFVGYSMAAQFPEAVERLVIGAAGVCMEEKDMEDGLFKVKSIDDAATILLPQTPDKMRELVQLTFYKPPKILPSCVLTDFIRVMCTEYLEERKALIRALHQDRKLSDLPSITQLFFFYHPPTLTLKPHFIFFIINHTFCKAHDTALHMPFLITLFFLYFLFFNSIHSLSLSHPFFYPLNPLSSFL